MPKPKVLIFSGYGLNCEEETKHAFELAGADVEIVHINDLLSDPKKIHSFQILVFPGGFSYGDDLGSGNAYANKLRNHLWGQLTNYLQKDHLIIGICNGFQILSRLGLLPASKKKYGSKQVDLLNNISVRYTVRWVDLKIKNDSPWLKGIDTLSTAVAHGEGNLFIPEQTLKQLYQNNQVALQYIQGDICNYQNLEANPNGSIDNIAGLTDPTGRILGLMPHPERSVYFTQLPDWQLQKEILIRQGKNLPKFGPGLQIFKNAVNYFNFTKKGCNHEL